ncbi:hypothetical protein TrVE_jg2128 [Triparma verrucosa]|uniref:Radical SAM core domain-containing protein n=1 Tax=Triparma verrucosa TaxID=1606542 RepID=A0A9W7C5X7_9STRA|nr:hypothetical protein TrVE_jg2128 [Triparma verrucosa]
MATTTSSRLLTDGTDLNVSQDGPSDGPQRPNKFNYRTATKDELEQFLAKHDFPKYRASQIMAFPLSTDPTAMHTLPKGLRDLLSEAALPSPSISSSSPNPSSPILSLSSPGGSLHSRDGTIKRSYVLRDSSLIESVLMPYSTSSGTLRHTACISSQAGCAQACTFCATGQMGFTRQLTVDEIVSQVDIYDSEVKNLGGKGVNNIVFMGMGEPLANYKNVVKAVHVINERLNIGMRKITVSTVGLGPNIRRLALDLPQVNLAVSLHESDGEKRSKLIPANERYGGLEGLMDSVRFHVEETGRRVTFEWALIRGVNDDKETARGLGELLKRSGIKRHMCHVNVIPLNPTEGFDGKKSDPERVGKFRDVLEKEFGVRCTVRVRRGIDVEAGCGQLHTVIEKRRKGERTEPEPEAETIGAGLEMVEEIEVVGGEFAEEFEGEDDLDFAPEQDLPETYDGPIDLDAVGDFDDNDDDDEAIDPSEAARILNLISPEKPPTVHKTKITDDDGENERKIKKLKKKLKGIERLEKKVEGGLTMDDKMREKLSKRREIEDAIESLLHNLK